MNSIFSGRKLVIATKHKKESVIAPVFEKYIGVSSEVADIDTDILWTFSGEIERKHDPITTLRKKTDLAFDLGYDLVVASEWSFGPHPVAFFLPAHEEILMFRDKINHLEIIERTVSLNPCFHGEFISSHDELRAFLKKIAFPRHSVILRKNETDTRFLFKGINTESEVFRIFDQGMEKFSKVFIQTDMRAHHNPTRMKVIGELAEKLAKRLCRLCPACGTPGFGIVDVERGLPCRLCHLPTQSIQYDIHGCARCDFRTKELHNPKKTTEDPGYCQWCNP